ncbi:MAG: SGNH/GDSL hydrolase family protein, partial [Armatimonadota bacterium]
GSNREYEEIIRNIRSRTTAEVLMQKDHATRWPPAVPDEKTDKAAWWDYMMNNVFLPEIAAKYGCALLDIRSDWLDYLKSNGLEPKALLSDDVHLNDWGNYLMAELVKRYLVYRPDLARNASWRNTVRTYSVGEAPASKNAAVPNKKFWQTNIDRLNAKTSWWKNGKLVLAFEGNRVDVISAYTGRGEPGTAQVRIDGKKPSEFPTLYSITRPTPGPWSPLALTRVDHVSPLKVEEWTLTVTSVSEDSNRWEFEVLGSVTGPDGRGSSDAVFVSKSGRVKIEPASFFRNGSIPKGYQIKWKVVPMHVDVYKPPRVEDPSREYVTTLAQGLPNTKHVLELTADNGRSVPIKAVRVYQPPVK